MMEHDWCWKLFTASIWLGVWDSPRCSVAFAKFWEFGFEKLKVAQNWTLLCRLAFDQLRVGKRFFDLLLVKVRFLEVDSPWKIHILNPKMEVWFRWFSFSTGWFLGEPAVNLSRVKRGMLKSVRSWHFAQMKSSAGVSPHLENASSRSNDTFGNMFSWAAVKPFVSSLNGLGLKLLGDLDALELEAQVLIKREGPAMSRLSSALLPFILKSAPPPIFNCQEEHGFHTIPTCSIFAYVGDAATGVGS